MNHWLRFLLGVRGWQGDVGTIDIFGSSQQNIPSSVYFGGRSRFWKPQKHSWHLYFLGEMVVNMWTTVIILNSSRSLCPLHFFANVCVFFRFRIFWEGFWFMACYLPRSLTASLPLKNGGTGRRSGFLLGFGIFFRGKKPVSGRVCKLQIP